MRNELRSVGREIFVAYVSRDIMGADNRDTRVIMGFYVLELLLTMVWA